MADRRDANSSELGSMFKRELRFSSSTPSVKFLFSLNEKEVADLLLLSRLLETPPLFIARILGTSRMNLRAGFSWESSCKEEGGWATLWISFELKELIALF